ncbi:MAG: glycosyltransferase family 2 protein [Candidatus Omnitrophota bacterium]
MNLSIITPSFNMLAHLKRAVSSIADQNPDKKFDLEHIIIDGGSTDGTVEWLSGKPQWRTVSEPDSGMYDALNKGLVLASGDILGYLNCDEQYLPGTLAFVCDYFNEHPDVDMLFGDVLLTRPDGSLVAFRKGYKPRLPYLLTSHLYVLTCTMFFRRQIIDNGVIFDPTLRAAGDLDFVVRVLQHGYTVAHVKRYLSAFTVTGKNLSVNPRAIAERHQLLNAAPGYIRLLKWPLNMVRLTEKFLSGAYFQQSPLAYAVYVDDMNHEEDIPRTRQLFSVDRPSFKWRFE